jgi:crotonobetainyl-CoA:carnitine CoA-transferase CaiB-like acyl-CoA transferase
VLDLDEVLDDRHLRARDAFVELAHPVAGPIKLLAPWFRFSETPAAITRVAPTLGQDNAEVYRDLLGVDDSELAELRAEHVI